LELDVVLADELRRLGLSLNSTFFKDRGHVGVGHEVPKALLVPVENHPHPAIVVRIAKDLRTLTPVLLSLFSALVENMFHQRSKSSIFAVDKTTSVLLR